MLEVKSLTKKYKNFVAVDNISFNVKEGEIFGLLGPNGAGKTTLIKMLTCFIKPSNGDALISGVSINKPSEVKRLIGIVPQEYSFYNKLTAYENLKYFASLYGMKASEIKSRADELLRLLLLTEKKNSVMSSLSGGMKRRVNIALALMHSPKVVFMDEPTVGIDPVSRAALWEVIKKIKSMKITILITTHYMEEADRLCDRIAIVNHGKLITIGTPSQLKKKYGTTLEDVFTKLVKNEAT